MYIQLSSKTKANSSNDAYGITARLMYKFLKKNNCLQKYVENVLEQCPSNYHPITNRYIKTKDILQLIKDNKCSIDYSFTWGRTPQGHEYWNQLNEKLESYIYQYQLF